MFIFEFFCLIFSFDKYFLTNGTLIKEKIFATDILNN